jgi:hypothetical protein
MKAAISKHRAVLCIGLLALITCPFWPILRSLYLLEYKAVGGPRSIPVLIGALNDNNELSSAVAMGQLASFGAPALQDLCAVVADKQEPHLKRARAAECLARMQTITGIPATAEVLSALLGGSSDENDEVRVHCLRALWRYRRNPTHVLPGLIALLSSRDDRVLYEAICTIEEIGSPARSAIDPLLELCHTRPIFATNALDAIAAIRGKQNN